ncbi:MAG: hypothetical protein RSB41_03755 [Bacilli bacterium]
MKNNGKIIAIGLGLGLSFTATGMSYSWFTDYNNQTHKITIGQLVEDVVKANIDVRFGGINDNKHNKITIDLTNIIEGKIQEISIGGEAKGEFLKVKTDAIKDNKISIIRTDDIFDDEKIGNKFTEDQMITINIIREVSENSEKKYYEDVYKFQFRIGIGGELEGFYSLISSKESNTLTDDKNTNNENEVPGFGEEVNPELPGGNIKPGEVPPANNDIAPPPGTKPNTPGTRPNPPGGIVKPDTEKPPTEEDMQNPEIDKPPTEDNTEKSEEIKPDIPNVVEKPEVDTSFQEMVPKPPREISTEITLQVIHLEE